MPGRLPARHPGAPHRRGSAWLTLVGVLLLVVGLGCLGYVGYQLVGTNVVAGHAFKQEAERARAQWQLHSPPGGPLPSGSPRHPGSHRGQRGDTSAVPGDSAAVPGDSAAVPGDSAAVPGNVLGLLRVPAFGADYEVPVLAGTTHGVLSRGVGHYSGTAGPGQLGNFAVAGHRITHGQPFARLLDLRRGDRVVVETATSIFTYVLDTAPRDLTVPASAGWVLQPVPRHPAAPPTRALITLTTCQDLFHSSDRSVAFGHLTATELKR